MKKGLKITLIIGGVVALGAVTYLMVKKKKESEDENQDSDGSVTVSNPRLYKGLTDAQTKILQEKLNQFYAGNGSLNGVSDFISNQWNNVKNFAKQTFKNTASLVVGGGIGFDAFKSQVASIMPLRTDGIYGKNTMAAVTALQTFLNANGASLVVDGKYGKNTDSITKWGIIATLSGLYGGFGRTYNYTTAIPLAADSMII